MADFAALERIDNLRMIGRSSDAEELIRTGLAEEPQDAQLLWRLGAVLQADMRYAEGLHAAQAAVAADPGSPDAHREYGVLLAETGDFAGAVAAAETAVDLAPVHAHTILAYSYVLGLAKRYPEAAELARKAVELAPHDPATHGQLGDVALMSGDRAGARRAYQEVLRLDPEHAAARKALASVDLLSARQRAALIGVVSAGRLDPNTPGLMPLVTAILSELNWRMRAMLVLAYLPVMTIASNHDGAPSWDTRYAALAVLAVSGAVVWWHARALPRGSHTVLLAALRGDGNLKTFYGMVVLGLIAYAAIAVTGRAPYVPTMWTVAIIMIVFTIASIYYNHRPPG
ncbi:MULTISPECIES: tetratricopeptide repeat protein [unclassified Mycobacterium]|uniref:tetratricopeptide repeat protein n=1 Tax=unclassified Mycobacterium TaxID=2642494 RepID=UPI0029C7957F|nr:MULTISPECIES: tetratricopeptide repeat protein [unclassified Mycobacterium]